MEHNLNASLKEKQYYVLEHMCDRAAEVAKQRASLNTRDSGNWLMAVWSPRQMVVTHTFKQVVPSGKQTYIAIENCHL